MRYAPENKRFVKSRYHVAKGENSVFWKIFEVFYWQDKKNALHLYPNQARRVGNNRRDGWVAETSSLLNCRTRKGTEGSNPSLSAAKFAGLFERISGCSAVRLAYLLWEQGVPGSNPGTPTSIDKGFGYSAETLFLFL